MKRLCILFLTIVLSLSFSSIYAEKREMVEFLQRFQKNLDIYEYERQLKSENTYLKNPIQPLIKPKSLDDDVTILFSAGTLYVNPNDYLINGMNITIGKKKQTDKVAQYDMVSLASAFEVLEYSIIDEDLIPLGYKVGLYDEPDALTQVGETLKQFDLSIGTYKVAIVSKPGNEPLIYEGENYNYYLSISEYDNTRFYNVIARCK